MKKLLLSIFVTGLLFQLTAQQSLNSPANIHLPGHRFNPYPPVNEITVSKFNEKGTQPELDMKDRGGDFILIGSAENVYGIYGPQRTYLWADPILNSLTFTSRGQEGIEYYFSTNGGNTWSSPKTIYPADSLNDPVATFPQGGIINPPGNEDPDNAWFTWLAPTADNSNGNLGGYAYGSTDLEYTGDASQVNISSGNGYWRTVPEAFTITPQGVAWCGDISREWDGDDSSYTGNVILAKGELNQDDEVEYVESLIPFLDSTYSFNDFKIAFSTDGQTGYFAALAYSAYESTPFTKYHPVLIKTTDGGSSWEAPVHVQLGGVGGIDGVKDYFSDAAIEDAGYEPGFDRDEVYYMMGYHFDLVLDNNGNPYMTGIIAIADEQGWYPYETQMATWNVYSTDGGATWKADALYDNIWFDAEIGNITVYNRPYASINFGGECVIFSWLDSEIDVAEQNDRPNIYVIAYLPEKNDYSVIFNITYFTQAWNHAFFGSQSYWFFVDYMNKGEFYECELPVTFVEFTVPGDELSPVNYWYIDGLSDDSGCPCVSYVGIIDEKVLKEELIKCFPNPTATSTEIVVNFQSDEPIKLSISNLTGQTVYEEIQNSTALLHSFRVDVSDFSPGVYLYQVRTEGYAVTKRLLVN